MVNIKEIDPSVIGVNKTSVTNYEIEYYGNLIYDSPLYLIFNDVDAYFLFVNEEKYLLIASTDKNKDNLENYKNYGILLKEKLVSK